MLRRILSVTPCLAEHAGLHIFCLDSYLQRMLILPQNFPISRRAPSVFLFRGPLGASFPACLRSSFSNFLTLTDLQLPGPRAERRRSQSLFLSCSSGKSLLNFNIRGVILVLPIKATIVVNIPEGAVQWGTLNGAMKH